MKFTNLRDTGRYGDGVSGETGSAACIGLISTKSAPVRRLASTSSVFRSSKSPTPHEPAERIEYSWAIQPHSWPLFSDSGSSTRLGALISVASWVRPSTDTCSVW